MSRATSETAYHLGSPNTHALILLLVVLSSCSANEVTRDPGAGRIAPPPPVCFDMTAQEYESALTSEIIDPYSKATFESGVHYTTHISCGLFAYYLRAAGSWYLVGLDEHTEAYQLLYLQPHSRPVLIRVVASPGQPPVVSAVRMLGWGDDPGEVDHTMSRSLSQSEWLRWSQLVQHLGFWSESPPFEKDEVVCMHGETYLFEGSRFEQGSRIIDSVKRRVWYPYCPQGDIGEDLAEAASFLFDLTAKNPRGE